MRKITIIIVTLFMLLLILAKLNDIASQTGRTYIIDEMHTWDATVRKAIVLSKEFNIDVAVYDDALYTTLLVSNGEVIYNKYR